VNGQERAFRPIWHGDGDPVVLCLLGCGGVVLDTTVHRSAHRRHHAQLDQVREVLGLVDDDDERRPREAVQTTGGRL
jgi:hypothetical protein